MIKTESMLLNGVSYTKTYSDTYQIKKVGTNEIYIEAVDIIPAIYEETNMELQIEPRSIEERLEAVESDIVEVINALAEVILI